MSNITTIEAYFHQYPQLCHSSNILKKYEDKRHLKELTNIIDHYIPFIEGNLHLIGYTADIIRKRVMLLNEYYNFIHTHDFDNLFSSQGKFRPTILEEFLFLLFKDFIADYQKRLHAHEILNSGSVKAYSNLFFKAKDFTEFITAPNISINEKDQDFAIYRKIVLTTEDQRTIQLQVPAIAIEAKTFIDKTMLDGIIATAEKVKSGNPYTMFVACTETYDVSLGVDPAYSRIDQIYVLRKTTRKAPWQDIDAQVVLHLFQDVQAHLSRPWSDVECKLKDQGLIL